MRDRAAFAESVEAILPTALCGLPQEIVVLNTHIQYIYASSREASLREATCSPMGLLGGRACRNTCVERHFVAHDRGCVAACAWMLLGPAMEASKDPSHAENDCSYDWISLSNFLAHASPR